MLKLNVRPNTTFLSPCVAGAALERQLLAQIVEDYGGTTQAMKGFADMMPSDPSRALMTTLSQYLEQWETTRRLCSETAGAEKRSCVSLPSKAVKRRCILGDDAVPGSGRKSRCSYPMLVEVDATA